MKFIILLAVIGLEAKAAQYSYVGCFTDQRNEWVFFWWSGSGINADQCSDVCDGQHFRYFGMAGGLGKECYCGSGGYDKYGPSGACGHCNVNGQGFTCGASNGDPWRLIAVYQLTSATAKMDERFIGCWFSSDPKNVVGSPLAVETGMSLTVTMCAKACKALSQKYAGVMKNGTECYCGNDLQWGNGHNPATTDNCDLICEDENKPCGGGSNHISLYRAVCLKKQYGLDCLPCHCVNDASCDTTSGVCPGSCDFGWMATNANSPCNVDYPLGLYSSTDKCNDSPTWRPNLIFTALRDGITSTCIDTSLIHNDTWRMLWKLDSPMRFQTVAIVYADMGKCFGLNTATVSRDVANCNQQSCPGEFILVPKAMEIPNECMYISPRNNAMFSDSVYFEFAKKVSVCEITMF